MATPNSTLEWTARGRTVAWLAALAGGAAWLGGDENARLAAAMLAAPVVVDFVAKQRRLHYTAVRVAPRTTTAGAVYTEVVTVDAVGRGSDRELDPRVGGPQRCAGRRRGGVCGASRGEGEGRRAARGAQHTAPAHRAQRPGGVRHEGEHLQAPQPVQLSQGAREDAAHVGERVAAEGERVRRGAKQTVEVKARRVEPSKDAARFDSILFFRRLLLRVRVVATPSLPASRRLPRRASTDPRYVVASLGLGRGFSPAPPRPGSSSRTNPNLDLERTSLFCGASEGGA